MTAPHSSSVPTTVSLRLPTGWIDLDPRTPDVIAELERALEIPPDSHAAAVALLAPFAAELSRAAADSDIVLVGFFAHAVEIDGSAEPLVLTANVLLAVSPPVEDIAQAYAALGGDVQPVDLPAGAAVLATGEVQIDDPQWDGSVPARTRRYLVPVPATDRVAVLHFLTPNRDLAEQFDEVFAAIADTLTFDPPENDHEGATP